MTADQPAVLPAPVSRPTGRVGQLRGRIARPFLRTRGFVGRHLSVRWKLTLWYGLMCGITLGTTGLLMRTVLQQRINSSIDANLRSTYNKLNPLLQQPGELRPGPDIKASLQVREYVPHLSSLLNQYSGQASAPGTFEQIQLQLPFVVPPCESASCRLFGQTAPYDPRNSRDDFRGVKVLPQEFFRVRMAGRPTYLTVEQNGEIYRAYLAPLVVPDSVAGQVGGLLEVFQNEHIYRQTQHDLDLILLLGIPLGVFVALVAGWWIARAALRPVNRISRTVQSIGGSRDLSRRLNFIGPVDEVGRLAETFDDMMGRLEEAFDAQKRFVTDASHELRTPLTAIRGNAELMRIAPPEEREICLTQILRESERMSRLVADMLLLAEADQEGQALHTGPVNLDDLLHDVYRSALVLAGDKVSVRFGEMDSVTIIGDSDRLKQLLLNLVDNAVKFTPAGGTVTVSLSGEPDSARIEISDTGIGISETDQQAIFRRFFRTERSRTQRGTGLGLAICAWIVEAHGGELNVKSVPGAGSTFTVRLPKRIDSAVSRPSPKVDSIH